ncbi:hypothetical protein ACOMHN_024946 [Nucella lapillus]
MWNLLRGSARTEIGASDFTPKRSGATCPETPMRAELVQAALRNQGAETPTGPAPTQDGWLGLDGNEESCKGKGTSWVQMALLRKKMLKSQTTLVKSKGLISSETRLPPAPPPL